MLPNSKKARFAGFFTVRVRVRISASKLASAHFAFAHNALFDEQLIIM